MPGQCAFLLLTHSSLGYTAAMKPNMRKDHSNVFKGEYYSYVVIYSRHRVFDLFHTLHLDIIIHIRNVCKVDSVATDCCVTTQRERTTF